MALIVQIGLLLYARVGEGLVLLQQTVVKRAAPLLVGSASCLYAIARARHLSMEEASQAPLFDFLLHQSDMILLLCGGPAVWYVSQRRQHQLGYGPGHTIHGGAARAIHQLRQVFSALLLGTELLARRSAALEDRALIAISERLQTVARQGAAELEKLGEPYPPDLIS